MPAAGRIQRRPGRERERGGSAERGDPRRQRGAPREACVCNTKSYPAVGRESRSWVASSTAFPDAAYSSSQAAKARLALRVEAARRLVQDEEVGLGHLDRRQREPLALAAREIPRVTGPPSPAPRVRARLWPAVHPLHCQGDLVKRGLPDLVAAGILGEIPARPCNSTSPPAARKAGGDLRQRGLAGPFGPRGRRSHRAAARGRPCPEPAGPPVRERNPAEAPEHLGGRSLCSKHKRRVARAVRVEPVSASAPGASSRMRPPSTKTTRVASASAADALLREHDGRAEPLDRGEEQRAPSGSSCEVGSSRSRSRGSSASAEARQTRWSSPPESSASSGPRDGARRPTRGRARRGARSPPAACRGSRARTRPRSRPRHHDLVLRNLEDRRDRAGELRRSRRPRVEPRDPTRPAKRPPWKCGTSPDRARRSVDLPDLGAEERHDLARLERQRHVLSAGGADGYATRGRHGD